MAETTRYEREIAKKENEDALAAVKASGKTQVYVLTDAERSAFKTALLPVEAKFEGTVGKENLAAIHRIVAEADSGKAAIDSGKPAKK